MIATDEFLRALPKAELHLHIEGSFEPELMFAIARRNGVAIPYRSVEQLRAAYQFSQLQDFLEIYYQGMAVLLTERDFRDLTWAYLERARADGAVHVEIFFDPQGHTDRGVPFATPLNGITAALREGEARLGLTSRLIMCFLRHLSEEAAFATLEQAKPHLEYITGVGLDSSESGHPPAKFARVFAAARALGLKAVAHAGEEGPPAYVRDTIDLLEVDRVDHGNRAMEDPDLARRIAETGMAFTVCPLSNLRLRVVRDLSTHPIRAMLEAGIKATVNSDDPAYFGGYLLDNFRALRDAMELTRAESATLARNSIEASFLDAAAKAVHLRSIAALASDPPGRNLS